MHQPAFHQEQRYDSWYNVSGFNDMIRGMEKVYQSLGVSDNFKYHIGITDHDIIQVFGAHVV